MSINVAGIIISSLDSGMSLMRKLLNPINRAAMVPAILIILDQIFCIQL